jgi:hypothetical protein
MMVSLFRYKEDMTIYFSFMLTAIILIALLYVRHELVVKIRVTTSLAVVEHNLAKLDWWLKQIIENNVPFDKDKLNEDMLLYPSERDLTHAAMILDLFKWSLRDFYPDVADYLEGKQEDYSSAG